MTIWLIVKFRDGTLWRVPADLIARIRAEQFIKEDRDCAFTPEHQLENEYQEALDDDKLLLEYATTHMSWHDVHAHAVKMDREPPDYGDEWANAEMCVIDYDYTP